MSSVDGDQEKSVLAALDERLALALKKLDSMKPSSKASTPPSGSDSNLTSEPNERVAIAAQDPRPPVQSQSQAQRRSYKPRSRPARVSAPPPAAKRPSPSPQRDNRGERTPNSDTRTPPPCSIKHYNPLHHHNASSDAHSQQSSSPNPSAGSPPPSAAGSGYHGIGGGSAQLSRGLSFPGCRSTRSERSQRSRSPSGSPAPPRPLRRSSAPSASESRFTASPRSSVGSASSLFSRLLREKADRHAPPPGTAPIRLRSNTSAATIPEDHALVERANASSDPEHQTLAEQLTAARNHYLKLKRQLDAEHRTMSKDRGELNSEKIDLKKAIRRLKMDRDSTMEKNQRAEMKLEQVRKSLDMAKLQLERKARRLEQQDLAVMDQLDRMNDHNTPGEGGQHSFLMDNSTQERWRQRLAEDRKKYIKEKDKYAALNLELGEHKIRLEEVQRRQESEKRDIAQQRALFKTAQRRVDEDRAKLRQERRKLDEAGQKLKVIKVEITAEAKLAIDRKQRLLEEIDVHEVEKEKLEEMKRKFYEDKRELMRLQGKAKAELQQLGDERHRLELEQTDLDRLTSMVEKEKQLQEVRQYQLDGKERQLGLLEKEITTIISSKKAERKAQKIIKRHSQNLISAELAAAALENPIETG